MAFVTEDNLSDLAVKRWATAHSPRLAELMTALVRHLHAYAREVRLTEEEWAAAVEWLTATGRISDDKRQEFILASDVLGLSTLVVQLNHRFSAKATPATVLGPFHIDGSPTAGFGADMSDDIPGAGVHHRPGPRPRRHALPDVVLDVWQADADSAYEAQLPEIDEARLRALYRTRADGTYCVRTIAPRGYAIPMDGPVGDLISRTDISHYRPAHVHFLIDHPGHEKLITHLFREGSAFLDTDVVFGTKDELIVRFTEEPAGSSPDGGTIDEPYLRAEFDFVLQPRATGEPRP
ncbi:catechol 1,2-dioxygenase [Streptomyces sp. NBC_00024]|uniref:dioxygenase n=1 Tax=Streptomyces sp. NBC_00024 TaxID=2903612 RepID=UPI0032465E55